MGSPWETIQEAARALKGRDEIFLCAPYITRGAFLQVLRMVPSGSSLTVVTRWRLDEIIKGVSDVHIWNDIRDREQSRLLLCWTLHAKYYRFGSQAYIGSANLTRAGLGLARDSNIEILSPASGLFPGVKFEAELVRQSREVDEAAYAQMLSVLASLPPAGAIALEAEGGELDLSSHVWTPGTRNPERIWELYSGRDSPLSDASARLAVADLAQFSLPPGMPKEAWRILIAQQLRQMAFVRDVFNYCRQSRRFGEVTKWLRAEGYCADRRDVAARLWQATLRWLSYFLPDSVLLRVPGKYSEVVTLVD